MYRPLKMMYPSVTAAAPPSHHQLLRRNSRSAAVSSGDLAGFF